MKKINDKRRLTEKDKDGTYYPALGECSNCFDTDSELKEADDKIEEKLGKLEDIEDALGITIDVLNKAMKHGFFVKTSGYPYKDIEFVNYPMFLLENGNPTIGQYDVDGIYFDVLTKDYGKTWALAKEELINQGEGSNEK